MRRRTRPPFLVTMPATGCDEGRLRQIGGRKLEKAAARPRAAGEDPAAVVLGEARGRPAGRVITANRLAFEHGHLVSGCQFEGGRGTGHAAANYGDVELSHPAAASPARKARRMRAAAAKSSISMHSAGLWLPCVLRTNSMAAGMPRLAKTEASC